MMCKKRFIFTTCYIIGVLCVNLTYSQRSKYDNDNEDVKNIQYLPPQIQLQEDDDHHHQQQPSITLLPPLKTKDLEDIANKNPLIAAILLTSTLGLMHKEQGFNHPQHLPVNPYVALFLSHYGRYLPLNGRKHGIYGYTASNNYHNNKPFGSYKISEDEFN